MHIRQGLPAPVPPEMPAEARLQGFEIRPITPPRFGPGESLPPDYPPCENGLLAECACHPGIWTIVLSSRSCLHLETVRSPGIALPMGGCDTGGCLRE